MVLDLLEVLAFSMVSLLVKEKMYLNEVVLGTAFGILMGPYCANIFDPRSWGSLTNTITLEVMRIVLATGLFAIGVELPQSYLADHAKGLLVMVVPTMAFGWVVVAGLFPSLLPSESIIKALFPMYSFVSALAVAACLTPTDPIICAAIVGGQFAIKHVPTNLRRILAAESAANDGLAYPFLSIAIYLTVEQSTTVAIGKWFLVGWLYQVIMGVVLGATLGQAFCYLMKYTQRKGFIDRESYVAQYLALALFTIGVTSTIGSDDLLAAFAAGSAISWDGYFNIQTENEIFSSVIDLVLNCGCFVYIGAWLPFAAFNSPDLDIVPWKLVVLFLAVLVLRRIPPLLLLYRWVPEIDGWKEALFSGHFGPMGVGAVFISTLALTRLPQPHSPPRNQEEYLAATLQTIVSFIVLGSILIHGLSIPFFSFGRKIHSRTISMSRTRTSRQPINSDWPLWIRRLPASPNFLQSHATLSHYAERTGSQDESENCADAVINLDAEKDDGTHDQSQDGTGLYKGVESDLGGDALVVREIEVTEDTDVSATSQNEATRADLKESGMIEGVGERNTNVTKRRFLSRGDIEKGMEMMDTRRYEEISTGTSGTQTPSTPLRIYTRDQFQDGFFISKEQPNDRSSPDQLQPASCKGSDAQAQEDHGDEIPSTVRTSSRTVRTPSDQ
ncbi:unnamed protein product [Somion occarium]|uniref:Cation/H+ exchanger transmembrane domain-containing protein n=1 Tax=Somion occarium TaxID=3059160 RepID=A0ABP1DM37_9APHY